MRTVSFQCKLRNFRGAHLKLWDYFTHVIAAPDFTPRISFAKKTRWDETNPWRNSSEYVVEDMQQVPVDVFFLGGRHWDIAAQHPNWGPATPVINFVQHVHHADIENDRFQYLSRPAIRICVAEEVGEALEATGVVRGPLIVIPNGIDMDDVRPLGEGEHTIDVLIAGLKRPEIGVELEQRLAKPGRSVRLLTERLPRAEYLRHVRSARVAVFLPNPTEGFYLPALEGLAAGTLVVCPDCVGNRTFCLPGYNAFRPAFTVDALVDAAETALALPPEEASRMRANGQATAERYSLRREREAFHGVLRDVDRLWQEALAAQPVGRIG